MGDAPLILSVRTPDQWLDILYRYDAVPPHPVAHLPFEVTCQRDPAIRVRGITGADGKARVSGLIPGPVDVLFHPDSDAQARIDARRLRSEIRQNLVALAIQRDGGRNGGEDARHGGQPSPVDVLNLLEHLCGADCADDADRVDSVDKVDGVDNETLFLLSSDPDIISLLDAFPVHRSERKSPLLQQTLQQLAALAQALKAIKTRLQFSASTQTLLDARVPRCRSNEPLDEFHCGDRFQGDHFQDGSRSHTCTVGAISMITGEALLTQRDFVIPGLIPLQWTRFYRSSNTRNRGLGVGWTHPASGTLQIGNDSVIHEDAAGRRIAFPLPQNGQYSTNSAEGLMLLRQWHDCYRLKNCRQHPPQPDRLFMGRHTLKLHALIDTAGNRWQFRFADDSNELQRIESSWGSVIEVKTDAQGHITALQQYRAGQTSAHTLVRYHYNAERDLIAVENADGENEAFSYHHHIIIRHTLPSGFNISFEWDQYSPQGKCLRHHHNQFQWDSINRIASVTEASGKMQQVHCNERGWVKQKLDACGHSTHFEYNNAGHLCRKIDAQGLEHQYQRDEMGNLTAYLDPAGGGFSLLYDDDFCLVEYTDARGRCSDKNGQLSEEKN